MTKVRNVVRPVRNVKVSHVTRTPISKYKHLNLNGVDCNILADNPVPSYKNKFDMAPHFKNKNDDEFICAATFTDKVIEDYINGNTKTDNFKNGFLRRIDENMVPYFFVYESDSLSLEEQLKNVDKILDSPNGECITSVTFSGSKSIHTLVKIPEKFRNEVKKDYKFYWNNVAQYLFQNNKDKLDKACATISRLTRQPNGTRENGKKQVCYYYNKDACLLESQFEWLVPIHNEELHKAEIERIRKEEERLLRIDALENNPENDLEKIKHFCKHNPKWEVVLEVLNGDTSSRENSEYLTALGMLKTANISEDIIREYLIKCKHDYPKFWPRSVDEYIKI